MISDHTLASSNYYCFCKKEKFDKKHDLNKLSLPQGTNPYPIRPWRLLYTTEMLLVLVFTTIRLHVTLSMTILGLGLLTVLFKCTRACPLEWKQK